jgi:hypothetical protein
MTRYRLWSCTHQTDLAESDKLVDVMTPVMNSVNSIHEEPLAQDEIVQILRHDPVTNTYPVLFTIIRGRG